MLNLTIIFILTSMLAASCATSPETPAARPSFDSETDCLNGTMIVTASGKYGLADTAGKMILPTVFDDLYFLSDDLAVAFLGECRRYFDKTGRQLGESTGKAGDTPEELLARYALLESDRRTKWDAILTSYEELRRYCLSDSASAGTAILMADEIRNALQNVNGPMARDQRERFEAAYSDFKR